MHNVATALHEMYERHPTPYADLVAQLQTTSALKPDARGLCIPGTIAAYRKDGHFPDGTVLVKEVFNTTTRDMTTEP